jgi:plasmid maintenance system antidote protein VapI
MNVHPLIPDWVACPGEILRAWIVETGFPRHLAETVYEIPHDTLDRVLDGAQELDTILATKLTRMTRIPETYWLDLEKTYRAGIAAGLFHSHE